MSTVDKRREIHRAFAAAKEQAHIDAGHQSQANTEHAQTAAQSASDVAATLLANQVLMRQGDFIEENEKSEHDKSIDEVAPQDDAPSSATHLKGAGKGAPKMGVAKKGDHHFSIAAAAQKMPPVPVPKVQLTAQDHEAFTAMSTQYNAALSMAQPKNLMAQIAQTGGSQGGPMPTNQAPTTPSQGLNMATNVAQNAVGMAAATSGMSAMAAFLILSVKNQNSGKDLMSTLSNLASQNRNDQLKAQQQANLEAEKQMDKAVAKQKALGPLAKIVQIFMTIIAAITTIVSLGTATPLGMAIMAAGAIAGLLIGGLVNRQPGQSFNVMGALEGMFTGASMGGLLAKGLATLCAKLAEYAGAQAALKAVSQAVEKLVKKMLTIKSEGAMAQGLEKAGQSAASDGERSAWQKVLGGAADRLSENTGAEAGSEGAGNILSRGRSYLASDKGLTTVQLVGNVGGAALGLTQSVADFTVQEKLIEAQKKQADAKLIAVMADMLQNQWQTLQDTMQGIQDRHNTAVNQAEQMVSMRFSAMQRITQNIKS